MPRFFFDISDGVLSLDDVGTDYPNAHAARDAALRTLPAMARDKASEGLGSKIALMVRGEDGRTLFTTSITLAADWLVDGV